MFSKKDFLLKARERFDQRQLNRCEKYQFTKHARYKMQQYNLSEQRVTRIIRAPKRTEEGIATKTIVVMQPGGTVKRDAKGKETWTQEIWVMYQLRRGEANHKSQITISKQITNHHFENPGVNQSMQLRIISAWRYPGMSPKRHPIPEEILRELESGALGDE